MLRVLRNARISIFFHRKSNHIFTVWRLMVLLMIRHYSGKSYRMFSEWLVEAYYLRTFLQLSHIPHFTTPAALATNTAESAATTTNIVAIL